MTESILAKYVDSEQVPSQEGIRCLNLVKKDGNCKAFPYTSLLWVDYNPSKGMLLHFATHTVTVKGRNLGPLYAAVVRFDLPEITEVGEKRTLAGEDETVVTSLHILQKPDGKSPEFEMPTGEEDATQP